MKLITAAIILFLIGFAIPSFATGTGYHGNSNGPRKGGDSTSNSASISGAASSSKSEARSTSMSASGSKSKATGGNATASGGQGGNGFGGQGGAGGSATNGGQNMNFAGSDMGKLAPDVSPPSMPSVTPCTTGVSGGLSIGGVGVGGGGYTYDDLCGWERQHNVAVATGDQAAATDIKHGMTMLRCQRMSPDDRKFFKACDALPKEEGKTVNTAFNSN